MTLIVTANAMATMMTTVVAIEWVVASQIRIVKICLQLWLRTMMVQLTSMQITPKTKKNITEEMFSETTFFPIRFIYTTF